MAPAGWYADPANRYQLRYFDGALWTVHVSNNGQAKEDPVPVGIPADWQWTFCSSCAAICHFEDDHCWRCISPFPEHRTFGEPPRPNPMMPILQQFQAAQTATTQAFETARNALEDGRAKDALRGFDEALWHRHFAETLMMQLPKNGTSVGLGVSLLTLGFGPTDLIVGPIVRGIVNKRTQSRREQSAANDRLIIQANGLMALANLPEILEKEGAEHDVLVRFAFAYQPPGSFQRADHSMPDDQLKNFIAGQIARIQTEFSDLNALLCDFVVHFQWLDLGRLLVQYGYPIGHLLTGERPKYGGSETSTASRGSRNEALRVLGLDETASDDEIKRAYRDMTKKFHPDRHATASEELRELAEQKMREINAAYDLLTST